MSEAMEDVSPSSLTLSYSDRSYSPPANFNAFSHSLASTSANNTAAQLSLPPTVHSPLPTPSQMTNQQVTQLIEDLRNVDLQIRLNSFRKIQVISQALGVFRTRTELIPYLAEFCDDDDEVLLILSSMLGEMVDAVGGGEHAAVLMQPLEQLAGSEETAVREKAVASLAKIVEQVNEQVVMEHVLPLVRRCATADWFTSRISATALFPIVYPRIPNADESVKKELRTLYANLCGTKKEETPMVKRAAAANLGAFASILDPKTLTQEFHPLLVMLSRDEIDSVRLLVVQSCVQILRVYVKDSATRVENMNKMKPIILTLAEDSSWRVRYMLADKFIELCATMISTQASAHLPTVNPSATSSSSSPPLPPNTFLRDDELTLCFMKLLEDPELEVRTSATLKCGEFARVLGSAKTMEKFFWIGVNGKPIVPTPEPVVSNVPNHNNAAPNRIPPLKSIVVDRSNGALHTKSALASVILQFTTVLSVPNTTPGAASPNALIIEHLLPLILQLLDDAHAEVRLGVIAKLGEEGSSGSNPNSPLTIEILSSSLLPALSKLATDPKWRVRLQTIQLIPSLAAFFQQELFHAKLFDTVLAWLGDSIWSIREAAIYNLVRLTQLFGADWAANRLLPKIIQLAADKSYVFRLTAVFAMKDLAPLLGAQTVSQNMLPLLLTTLSKDPVPNVRFNTARLLGFLAKESLLIGPNTAPSAEKVLTEMKDDADADVKYCAQQALREGFGK